MRTSDTDCSDVSLRYFTATLLITEPCVKDTIRNSSYLIFSIFVSIRALQSEYACRASRT